MPDENLMAAIKIKESLNMFEVIGERINTSRKLVRPAIAERDAAYIIDDVTK